MKRAAKGKFWLSLVILSLIGQIAWVVENMYFNVFIYQMFHASAAEISLMVAASAVAATLTTIFIGALSDRVGKRKLFISAGYILWGISILAFAALRVDVIGALFPKAVSAASVGISLVIIFDCLMTFFGSSANDACFNAWLTDATDDTNRGKAEGINAMMPLLAIIFVFGGTMWADTSNARHWTILFLIIGGVVLSIGLLSLFILEEPARRPVAEGTYLGNILYGFRPAVVRANTGLYLTLGPFAVFSISIQIFMPYLILYYTEALKLSNYVLIMAPAVILAAGFTAYYGRLYDRFGYEKTLLPALLLLLGGYGFLFLTRATAPVFIGSLLMMSGYLAGCAVFGARIRACTPVGMAGRFQGLRIVAQVLIPGIIGPAIGAAVLAGAEVVTNGDGTTSFIPNANIFLAAAAAIVPVLVMALVQGKGEGKQQGK